MTVRIQTLKILGFLNDGYWPKQEKSVRLAGGLTDFMGRVE